MSKFTENEKLLTQRRKDRAVLADPDIRGVRRGRRGIGADARYPNGDDVARVERAWNREGRG